MEPEHLGTVYLLSVTKYGLSFVRFFYFVNRAKCKNKHHAISGQNERNPLRMKYDNSQEGLQKEEDTSYTYPGKYS